MLDAQGTWSYVHSYQTHYISRKTSISMTPYFCYSSPVTPMLCCSTQRNRYRHMSPHQHPGVACMRLGICPQVSSPASVLLPSICTVLLHAAMSSEVGALRRLRQFLVGGRGHVSSDLDEHGLHGEIAFPVCYAWELGEVDLWLDVVVSILYFESRLSLIVVVGFAVPCHCFR
jgi:hypothetical protein